MINWRAFPTCVITGIALSICLSSATSAQDAAAGRSALFRATVTECSVGRVSSPTSAADELALRALYALLMDGWNRGSGAAFASVFDENADLIGPGGFHIRGRDRIAAFHQMLFDGMLKGTRLEGDVRSVRFLTGDVALVHAVGRAIGAADPQETPKRNSVHSLLAVRRDGKWLLDAFQNTPI